jgi:hypothetical protein
MNLKERILKKSNLWHVGAIALFVIVACVYFSPALKGYSLNQGDIVNFSGMSREAVDYRDNSNEQILWTNSMFSGMPTTQISMKYEGDWLTAGLTKLFRLGLPAPIFFLFVYFISFYILALSLRVKPLIGMIGSIAFGFSSYFIVILEAGHNSKAAAIGFAPLMLAGFIMAYRNKNWVLGAALSSLFMAVELSANHVQITYYMAFVLLMMGIVELVRHIKNGEMAKFSKSTGLLIFGYLLAVLVNYGNLFGTVEYSKQTIRGGTELTILPDGSSNEEIKTSGLDREYVTNWSYGRGETFTLMVPDFKGGESMYIGTNDRHEDLVDNLDLDSQSEQFVAQSNQYWGEQPFTSGPVYIGIIVMFLALLAMIYIKDKYKWALLSATLLAICLSWGKNYVSAFVLLPIILYLVNVFLTGKKQLIFTGVNTLILLIAMFNGEMFVESSLTDFFLDVVPGYNKLRAVTIILVVAELCIPILGILFLQKLISKREEIKEDILGFYIGTGAFLIVLLAFLAAPTSFNDFITAQENAAIESIPNLAQQQQYMELFGALEEARISIFTQDVLRSLGFFSLGAILIFTFIRFGYSKYILGSGLLLFILIDLVNVDQRYLNNDGTGKRYENWVESYQMKYPFLAGQGEKDILKQETFMNPGLQAKIDSALAVVNEELKSTDASGREKQARRDYITFRVLNRNTNFRVFEQGNPFNSSYTSYFNKSIGGYHGAKLSRYQDLIDFHLSKGNPAVINMLNAKYFLVPKGGPTGIENSQLVRVNQNAMGNAWLAKEIQIVENADQEILAMNAQESFSIQNKGAGQVMVNGVPVNSSSPVDGSEEITVLLPGMAQPQPIEQIPYQAAADQPLALVVDTAGVNWIYDSAPDSMFNKIFTIGSGGMQGWDPEETTIMDDDFKDNISAQSYSGQGTISMTNYHPDRMTYQFSSPEKQLAVFSEVYYDGWKAYVDGNEVPVSRVNYVLRAIEVPAGDHEIKFEFESETFEKAGLFANIGSLGILLLIIFGIYLEVKRKEENTDLLDE